VKHKNKRLCHRELGSDGGARPPNLAKANIFLLRNWSLDLFVSFAIKRKRKENYLGRIYSIAKQPLKINILKKMSWVTCFWVLPLHTELSVID
jgi:hypothetical protein